mmetsp:Transcript_20229/g.50586  ORF Transcript_20229/g.50586 Transcript_20229/m.50586 type:complete len:303 (-) Transcript_20229:133-1041(-)
MSHVTCHSLSTVSLFQSPLLSLTHLSLIACSVPEEVYLSHSLHSVPEQVDLLLLEVPPVLLIHQHQVKVVFHTEPVGHVFVGGREVVGRQEQPHRNALPTHGSAIHNLVFGDGLTLVVRVGTAARALPPPNLHLHVLDLDPHQQEEDLTNHHVLEMVLGLGVLKLDVQAVLDAHLHFDGVVDLGRHAGVAHPELELLHHSVAVAALHGHPQKVPRPHVDAVVGLVWHLHPAELERNAQRTLQLPRRRHLPHQADEVIRVAAVKVQFNLPQHLDLHSQVLHFLSGRGRQVHVTSDGVAAGKER